MWRMNTCRQTAVNQEGKRRWYDVARGDLMLLPGRRAVRSRHALPSSAEESEIMVMPTRETAVTTIDELLALPDDGLRHELLDGVHVVTPAPAYPHQAVLGEFDFALRKSLEGQDELDRK